MMALGVVMVGVADLHLGGQMLRLQRVASPLGLFEGLVEGGDGAFHGPHLQIGLALSKPVGRGRAPNFAIVRLLSRPSVVSPKGALTPWFDVDDLGPAPAHGEAEQ